MYFCGLVLGLRGFILDVDGLPEGDQGRGDPQLHPGEPLPKVLDDGLQVHLACARQAG